MRVRWAIAAIMATVFSSAALHPQPAPLPSQPAGQLVRDVVANELNDHARHGYWRYWVQRRSQAGTRLEDQIETVQGPVTLLTQNNGRPIDSDARQQEQTRLERLVSSPSEQARHLQQYEEDEQRIGRILALLPDAFFYDYEGADSGALRLRFRPNPDFPAHSIEARVFHAMSGQLWVNPRLKRLVRLEGRIAENVDFGFGILGRLYKGGWFRLVRTQVSPTDWKTSELEVHMSIRALLVKTFAKETSEARGGFAPVPPNMNLAQATRLLEHPESAQPVAASAAVLPAAFPVQP